MMIIDTVSPDSFYNSGHHFLFFLLLTATTCLLVDLSPLQKHPMCQLNFWLASVVAATVPAIGIDLVSFPSPWLELSAGIGAALCLSVLGSLAIQRLLDVDINY